MEGAMAWCAFVGSWLLVSGSIYQAAIELEEEGLAWAAIKSAAVGLPRPRHTSPWWWLVPPLAYLLQRRRTRAFRHAVMAKLDEPTLANLVRYVNKTAGWLFVAGGGTLLAIHETWLLRAHYGWSDAVFGLLAVGMATLAVANVAWRSAQAHRALARAGAT